MNTKLTHVVYIGIVFGAGIAAGYFGALKRLEEEYAENTEAYRQIIYDGLRNSDDKEAGGELKELKNTLSSSLDGKPYTRAVLVNYNKPGSPVEMFKDLSALQDDEPEDEDAAEDEEDEDDLDAIEDFEERAMIKNDKPYVITLAEYEENEHFDKELLFYYAEDGVFCDENEEVLDSNDWVTLIGKDWVLTSKRPSYIRNEGIGSDYEIRTFNQAYNEDIVGRLETPKEKETRRSKVQKQRDAERRKYRAAKTSRQGE